MKTLKEYLADSGCDAALALVFEDFAECVRGIASDVRGSDGEQAGSSNVFGEEQLALDVLADERMVKHLRANQNVGLFASEEQEEELEVGEGRYGVCADPLDGSSLVDSNLAVGTIVGIYDLDDKKGRTFFGRKGDEQVGVLVAVYGPRTTIFVTVRDGAHEFVLKNGQFVMQRENLKVGEGKMFAPGNLRACSERPEYLQLLNFWAENKYTLRYSGGMVPDIGQILIKGKGIFAYPSFSEMPNGKLRVLYECAPMALLMEQAGGAASNGGGRILDIEVKELAQRSPIFIGSVGEVERCEKALS